MIISDLQYIESVDANVQGGGGYKGKYKSYYLKYSSNAYADAGAEAFGQYNSSYAYTQTFTAPGASFADSVSSSSSYGYYY
jgi:hypothetical protein